MDSLVGSIRHPYRNSWQSHSLICGGRNQSVTARRPSKTPGPGVLAINTTVRHMNATFNHHRHNGVLYRECLRTAEVCRNQIVMLGVEGPAHKFAWTE